MVTSAPWRPPGGLGAFSGSSLCKPRFFCKIIHRGESLTAALLLGFVGHLIEFGSRRLLESQTRPAWPRPVNVEQNTVGQSKWEQTPKNAQINRSRMWSFFATGAVLNCRHTRTNQLPPQPALSFLFFFIARRFTCTACNEGSRQTKVKNGAVILHPVQDGGGEGVSLLNSWGKSTA